MTADSHTLDRIRDDDWSGVDLYTATQALRVALEIVRGIAPVLTHIDDLTPVAMRLDLAVDQVEGWEP